MQVFGYNNRCKPNMEATHQFDNKQNIKNIGIMSKVGQFLTKEVIKTLYYTLVYPYFHYCNIIWANNYPSRLTRTEILQKRAVIGL